MSIDPGTIAHRWFNEVWNEGREQTIDDLLTADGTGYGLGEGEADVHGPAEFKVFWRNLRSAFPDAHIAIEDTIADRDKVAVRLKFTGTLRGDTLGVPANGQRVAFSGVVIFRVTEGRIAEAWNSWDQLGMLRQIGATPTAPAQDRFLTKPT